MNETEIPKMCDKLGVPNAPLVESGIRTTLKFFRDVLWEDPFQWCDYIRGIDFHKPVYVDHLLAGTRLSRHTSLSPGRDKPFVYYTKPGTSPFRTGTSFEESEYELFEVPQSIGSPIDALVSYASGIKFHPGDRVSRLGGGLQYVLSHEDSKQLIKLERTAT